MIKIADFTDSAIDTPTGIGDNFRFPWRYSAVVPCRPPDRAKYIPIPRLVSKVRANIRKSYHCRDSMLFFSDVPTAQHTSTLWERVSSIVVRLLAFSCVWIKHECLIVLRERPTGNHKTTTSDSVDTYNATMGLALLVDLAKALFADKQRRLSVLTPCVPMSISPLNGI